MFMSTCLETFYFFWKKVDNLHSLEFGITTFSNHKNTYECDEKIILSKTHNTHHTPKYFCDWKI